MTEDDGSNGESLYLRGDYEEAVAAWGDQKGNGRI